VGKKNKRKLTPDQRQWLENLEEYLEKKVRWQGDQDLREVIEGRYVVLSDRGPPIFNCAIGTDDLENAEAIVKYNCDTHARIVDLDTLQVVKDVKRHWSPEEEGYDKGDKE
jgi:hypothetical protein